MKIRPKWHKLIHHFERFVDRRWHPNFKTDEETKLAFVMFQSNGKKSLTPKQWELVQPLLNGQVGKELTIKMLVEEMAEYWAKGWGWYVPLMATLKWEFRDRHIHQDKEFIQNLIAIARHCKEKGFFEFFKSFTGLTFEEKVTYFKKL
jgi:hypothetical protein